MAKQVIQTNVELEEYEFVDKNGVHLYTIRFSPTDIGIVKRYQEVVDWFDEKEKELDGIKDGEDGLSMIMELSDGIKEKMDFLLNASVSKEIFSVMDPLTILASGEFYAIEVLDGIIKLIEKQFDVRAKKVKSRMTKYTAKYHK